MLTYSLSFGVVISPLHKIVAAQFAKTFWNSSFKYEELYAYENSSWIVSNYEEVLLRHLEKTISDSNSFIEKYKLPVGIKPIFKKSIISFYQAYREFIQWKIRCDSFYSLPEILRVKEDVDAQNYFSADGEFNDLIWVKRFVFNSDYSTWNRFGLACLYCLQNEIEGLWAEVKRSDSAADEYDLEAFWKAENLVNLWISQLEGQFEDFKVAGEYEGNFWEVGFHIACNEISSLGYFHSVCYFWRKIDDSKKKNFIENHNWFQSMRTDASFPDDKMSCFFYSQLSKEQKQSLFHRTIENKRTEIWRTLLVSPHTETVRCEILEFVRDLPKNMIFNAISYLNIKTKAFKFPYLIEAFKALWCSLSVQVQSDLMVSEKVCIHTIELLIDTQLFCSLEHTIKCFQLFEKMQCLYNGPNMIDLFSKKGEIYLLPKYLSLFLYDRDPSTRKETLRKYASTFFENFIYHHIVQRWCREIRWTIGKEAKSRIENRTAIIRRCLVLISQLRWKISEESQRIKMSTQPEVPESYF